MAYLRNENKALRDELKRLNKLLTEFLEVRRAMFNKKQAITKGPPKPEVRLQEVKNAEKQLSILEIEYDRVSKRTEQLSNPQYLLDLKERLISLEHRIKKTGKNKKTLETEQVKREKIIDKVIEEGEPERLQEINHLKTEAAMFEKKLKEINEVLEKNGNSLTDMSQRMENAKSELKKLTDTADKQGVREPTETAKTHDLEVRYKNLFFMKENLMKGINLLKTRFHVTMGDYSQKKVNIQKQISSIAVTLHTKNE